MNRKQVREAVRKLPPEQDFVWDGRSEDDRPASAAELLQAARRRPGRPAGSGNKEQVALRIDRDVLERFRATGPGWQTRMNDALREWLASH